MLGARAIQLAPSLARGCPLVVSRAGSVSTRKDGFPSAFPNGMFKRTAGELWMYNKFGRYSYFEDSKWNLHIGWVPGPTHYQWRYRQIPPEVDDSHWTMQAREMAGMIIWFWILFHCYKDYGHIIGEFPLFDERSLTDAELGIPDSLDDIELE